MIVALVHTDMVSEGATFHAVLNSVSARRQERVLRLAKEDDRRRSLCAAVALDACLQTVGLRERDVEIVCTEQGKPLLRDYPQIAFNLSHSGTYAVCALADSAVGVDMQQHRAVDVAALAQRYFTPQERQWWEDGGDREDAFFRLWTAKESLLKAEGVGLSGVSRFSVVHDGCLQAPPWHFREYAVPGYTLTVCGTEPFPDELTVISSCDSVLLR